MKRVIIAAIAILACSSLSAQQRSRLSAQQHEFSVSAGGGLSALNYQIDDGAQKGNMGIHFGLGYRYELTPGLGVLTGVGFGIYNSTFTASRAFSSQNEAIDLYYDNDPQPFTLVSELDGYEERQGVFLLQVPVMGQYVHDLGAFDAFVNAGLKLGLPISGKYSSNVEKITNIGKYPEYDYSVQKFRGFGEFTDQPYSGDLEFKMAVMFSIEAGAKFSLSRELSLYVGAFFDLGLNNIHKTAAPRFIEYFDAPADFKVNSVIHSQYENFTDKVAPMAVGIKLTLAMNM